MSEAINLFHEMLRVGCIPGSVSVQDFISCFIRAAMPNEAKSILLALLEKGCTPDLFFCSSIINDPFREWEEHDATQLIKALLDRKTASLASGKVDIEVLEVNKS